MALPKQTLTIPLIGGLNQKADPRALQPPGLAIAKDIAFAEIGGVQTRYPFAALGTDILGGGAIASPRRLFANEDELLLFTATELYAWDVGASAWVLKGTHLACTVEESPVLVNTDDQYDADMAIVGGVIFYAWYSALNAGTYLAVLDAATGVVIVPPFKFAALALRPRLTALASTVLLTYNLAGTPSRLVCAALDPTALTQAALGASATATLTTGHDATPAVYDIKAAPDGLTAMFAARYSPTASYGVGTVDAALAVTLVSKARTCDGNLAIAISPDGAHAQVFRGAGGAGKGDLLTYPMLADVATDQAISASSPGLATCCYQSTQVGGEYRCYILFEGHVAWADTGGTISAAATLNATLTVCSQAFDHDGGIYVWAVFNKPNRSSLSTDFSQTLQNAYYLLDTSGTVHAKAAYNIASGNDTRLSSVVDLEDGSFAWCTSIARLVAVAAKSAGYAQRTLRRIDVTFDDDRARRCVRLGHTVYIAGGEIRQYDGVGLYEVGFHVAPWDFFGAYTGAGGNIDAGVHAIKATYRWENAQGEIERSSTTNIGTGTAVATDKLSVPIVYTTTVTHKGAAPAVELWRTLKDPEEDDPFFLVTSKDPSSDTNPNRYLANNQSGTSDAFEDVLSDADLELKERTPGDGTILENLAPPAATIIAADPNRVYLAGIAGSPNAVWYSKQRGEGEIATFNDGLVVQLPATGGPITALAFLNETLIVFKETAIYALPGDGNDNTGGGSNYGPPRVISADVGALNAEAVALTDLGLVFKSFKGWHLLNRGWSVDDLGLPVADYDAETPLAVHLVRDKQEIRCLSGSRLLVFTYTDGVKQWSESTITDGLDACVWRGVYTYLASSGVKIEQASHATTTHGIDLETGWIKFAELVGFARVYRLILLGAVKSPCSVRVRAAYDYDDTYVDDKTKTYGAGDVGKPLELQHGPKYQQCAALKLRITVTPATTGESVNLTGLGLEVGLKPGLYRLLAAAQKQ